MPRNPRGTQGIWGRLGLIIVGTLAGFFLTEGLLVFVLPPPIVWRTPQERYRNHPTRLFELRPNQQAYTHDKPIRINALGFRGEELQTPKPAGRFRIVVMGDSVTFGNGVGDEATYSAQLARMFHDAGLLRVEVINAGIPAYDTWQQALLLEEVILSLEPDLVILGFYENDISPRPNVIHPIINRYGESPRSGFGTWLGDRWIFFLKKSRVLLLSREAYRRVRARWSPSPAAVRRMALLNGDQHPSLEVGWDEVKRSLNRMQSILNAAGIPFRIVIFPMPEQVWNAGTNASTYQGYLQGITRELGVQTLDLLPAFRSAVHNGKPVYIPWDWHPNAAGHEVAAGAIASFVQPMVNKWMVKNTISDPSENTQTITGHPNLPSSSALPASIR